MELDVRPEDVAAFKAALRLLTVDIRRKEADSVLSFDYFSTDASLAKCIIHEVYEDTPAFVRHLEAFDAPIAEFLKLSKVSRMLVIGKIPQDILARFEQFAGNGLRHFGNVISTLHAA